MAKNFVKEGGNIDWTNGGAAVASGDVVIIGALVAIALVDIANGATGTVATEGVWEVPKKNAAVIAAGETVLWDSSTGDFDDNAATPAAGDVLGGAWAIEGKGATTGETIKVKLAGQPGALT